MELNDAYANSSFSFKFKVK